MFTCPRSLLAVFTLLAPAAGAEVLKVPSPAYPTIQAAVDAAVPGDEILIAKGRYRENVVVGTEGIALSGKGAIIDGGYAGPCVTVNASIVALQKLVLVNGTAGISGDGDLIVVASCTVSAASGAGIAITGDSAIVAQCVLTDNAGAGISIVSLTTDNEAIVYKNRVERSGADGIALSGKATFFVIANRCVANLGRGISLFTNESGVSEPPRLLDNLCERNGGDGMSVETLAGGAPVEGNKCLGNGGDGIDARTLGTGPDKNTCNDNLGAGIRYELLGGASLNGNTCRGNALQGIRAIGNAFAGPLALTGNKLARNGRDGILATGGNVLLMENRCDENRGDGIDIDDDGTGYSLFMNRCQRNGHEGFDNSGIGTVVNEGNSAKDNGGLDLAGAGSGSGSLDVQPGASIAFVTGAADAVELLDL